MFHLVVKLKLKQIGIQHLNPGGVRILPCIQFLWFNMQCVCLGCWMCICADENGEHSQDDKRMKWIILISVVRKTVGSHNAATNMKCKYKHSLTTR